MKKAILVLLVGLLWCNTGFAISQQSAINKYLSGKKLENVEGVWVTTSGGVFIAYKQGTTFYTMTIRSSTGNTKNGEVWSEFQKGSKFVYYGDSWLWYNGKASRCNLTITVRNPYELRRICQSNLGQWDNSSTRIWPENFENHNAKFKTKEDVAEEERVLATMVNAAKKTCKVLGFEDGSEKMADCTLKLYSQKVDELVAEKQAANALMTQSQTTTTTQSSGSNTVTIYDPVRDRQRMINQGMGMVMGTCSFGVNC